MCTRCDHIPVKDRGTFYKVHATGITKAKEHLAVHCPGIRPDVNSEDAAFRHALLLGISEKYKLKVSKKGQAMIAAAEKLERQGGPATHRPDASRAADDNSVGNSNRQSRAPLLEQLGVTDNNICTWSQMRHMNGLIAKFIHKNGLSFEISECPDLFDILEYAWPAYAKFGLPKADWIGTKGVELVKKDVRKRTEDHLSERPALAVAVDAWENEKKQNLKIVTVKGTILAVQSAVSQHSAVCTHYV